MNHKIESPFTCTQKLTMKVSVPFLISVQCSSGNIWFASLTLFKKPQHTMQFNFNMTTICGSELKW